MADPNIDLAKRGIAALREGGVEALLPLIHPDFEMTTPPELASEPGTYRGIEGLRRYFDSFSDAMDDVYLEGREYVAAGEDMIVMDFALHARGRTSGIEAVQYAHALWTARDGKLLRMAFFTSRDEALAAAAAAG